MTKIIAIAGAARAGKDSLANAIIGEVMKSKGVIKKYQVNDEGHLLVNAVNINNGGSIEEFMGRLDLETTDPEIFTWLNMEVFPYAKKYMFATPLKWVCSELLGINREFLYGTTEQKNLLTDYYRSPKKLLFSKTPSETAKQLTVREVMTAISDVTRKINPSMYIDYTLKRVLTEGSEIAIISDLRSEAEFQAVKEIGGTIVYLTRRPQLGVGQPKHSTEIEMYRRYKKEPDSFDIIVHNKLKSIRSTNNNAIKKLKKIGIL